MGSAKVPNSKPQTMESKSFKPLSILKSFFHIDTKKEKAKDKELIDKRNESKTEATHKKLVQKNSENTVASILEPFKKLELQTIKKETVEQDDDERDNFTFNVINDDIRPNRIDSQSSEDSGFAENNDVVETLEKLTLNEKEGEDTEQTETKEKKTRQVLIKRAPIRTKLGGFNAHPYNDVDNASRPISQINKQTLSGGQVIVNPTTDTFEFDEALQTAALQNVEKIYNADPNYWEDLLDVISNDHQDSLLSDFPIETNHYPIDITPIPEKVQSPIEEFSELSEPACESVELSKSLLHFEHFLKNDNHSMFPTPPRSENVPSPLSETQAFYPSNSEYTLSPSRSSPIYNSDFEKYQTISPLYDEFYEEKDMKKDGDRASIMSLSSSMTMKNFKDLQKEISNEFSKMECCDIDRESTKKIFEQHMEKLKPIERKNLCFKVSKLDLKTAYGVIHNILLSLSKECAEQEDLQYALFALTCQRVLAQNPALFVADFGLSILKAAALRCPHRPLLTRHIVHCVYLVLRSDPKLCANECVFHEVDAQCDNLVIACARGGDAYALVLAEITRGDTRGELPPLFRLHHSNADGYTALHVACRQHAATKSHLNVVHALLDHAQADMWKGDIKGGDTALHLAVNSSTCDHRLVVTLFKHLDRKLWKKLAHAQNMSSVTPLEYARSATKSTTRKNYPTEVLDFLKKCR